MILGFLPSSSGTKSCMLKVFMAQIALDIAEHGYSEC